MRETGISFNGVAIAARHHHTQLLQAFSRVLNRGVFLNGPENACLEKDLTHILKGGYVTTVASGHDALMLSLQSLQLPSGSEILVPINAYPTAFPVSLSGLSIVPVDVDRNGQIDPEKAKKAITAKTRAIIMVHLYGLVGDLIAIKHLCRTRHLWFIEDAAQAFGTRVQNKYVGTFGDIGCFSFYPTKNLGSLGDGGAIWTKSRKRHTYIQQATMYGERYRYKSIFISGHSRLPELQAAGLLEYLKLFPTENRHRKQVASWYLSTWRSFGLNAYGHPLLSTKTSIPTQHLFAVSVTKRDALQKYLSKHHIPTLIHYPYPIHRIPAFTKYIRSTHMFPQSEQLAKSILSLPFHAYLTKTDVIHILTKVKQFYASNTH